MADIDTLRILAGKATPGPWKVYDGCSWRRIGTAHSRHDDCAVLAPCKASDGHPDLTASRGNDVHDNLEFIAACDPQTVLALLDENERLRAALLPFASLDMPAAEKWTCGTFLIEHSDIRSARAALSEHP